VHNGNRPKKLIMLCEKQEKVKRMKSGGQKFRERKEQPERECRWRRGIGVVI
jgi:hypothetical protein